MWLIILIMIVAIISPKIVKTPNSVINLLYVRETEDEVKNVENIKDTMGTEEEEIDKYVVDTEFDSSSEAEDLLKKINGK